MVTREALIELAKKVAVKRQLVTSSGMRNVYGLTPGERVDMDADMMVLRAELDAAERAYQEALKQYVPRLSEGSDDGMDREVAR
jgi:hypothetical protein